MKESSRKMSEAQPGAIKSFWCQSPVSTAVLVLEVISLVLLGWTSPLWGASTEKLFVLAPRDLSNHTTSVSHLCLWKLLLTHLLLSPHGNEVGKLISSCPTMPKFSNGNCHSFQILCFSYQLCRGEKLLSPCKVIPVKPPNSWKLF